MTSRRIGRFELVERVARGGMGEIYRGLDTGLPGVERPVAIKLIRRELAESERYVQDFIGEAKVSFLISHPNVVQLLDAGLEDDAYFMAMEWIDGADLSGIRRRLKEFGRRMPLELSLHIAIEAARGLDYAHRLTDAQGRALHLVHRDVSPSNILVSFEGAVKVSDFGIAKSSLRQGGTQVGHVRGKIGYMAPEQARGQRVDARADVFSLGVVLYELVTGANPFTEGASDAEALMRVQQCVYRPARAVAPELAPALDEIITRAMVSDPAARYATASELRDALERFASEQGLSPSTSQLSRFVRELMDKKEALPTSVAPTRVDGAAAAPLAATSTWSPPTTTTPDQERRPGAGRAWWLGGGAVTVAAAAAAVWGFGRAPVVVPAASPAVAVVAPPPAPSPAAPPPEPPTNVAAQQPPARPPAKTSARLPPRPAQLTVTSDLSAMVYVDGESLGEAPIRGTALAPGHHTLRAVDLNRNGMRRLPIVREIVLKPGETRQVDLAFQ